MNTLLLIVLSYIIGSIPTGYWVVKAMKGIDLRKVGSGSTGTTNVLRNAGKPAAIFVFVIDILKGYVPVTLAIIAVQHGWLPELSSLSWLTPWVPPLAGITAMIGHSKSVFLNFSGGKSAATGCGTLIGCNPVAGFSSLGFWFLVLGVGKIVSVASIAAAISCAIFMYFFTQSPPPVPAVATREVFHWSFSIYAAIGGLYVVIRHKANIQRLIAGTEPRVGQKLEDAAKKVEQEPAT